MYDPNLSFLEILALIWCKKKMYGSAPLIWCLKKMYALIWCKKKMYALIWCTVWDAALIWCKKIMYDPNLV